MKPHNRNHMTTHSSISNTVMRRVRIIHAVRPLLSSTALGSLLFLLALYGIGREVWVSHVLQNFAMVAKTGSVLTFLTTAFVNTRFVVQVLVVLAAGAFVYTLRELARPFTFHRYV
jgi:hypothetical protein